MTVRSALRRFGVDVLGAGFVGVGFYVILAHAKAGTVTLTPALTGAGLAVFGAYLIAPTYVQRAATFCREQYAAFKAAGAGK